MMKILKLLFRAIAIILLLLLPFLPITESFFPPEKPIDQHGFTKYLLMCLGIILLGFALMSMLKKQNNIAAWLLFLMGLVSLIPLHLGPPRMGPELLQAVHLEQFRYGILLMAILLLLLAGLKILTAQKTLISKIFLGILIATVLLNLWDNFTSFQLGSELKSWVENGNQSEEFFAQYNFKINWRALSRILLYLNAITLTAILLKWGEVKKWQFMMISLSCLTGMFFCIRCLQSGFEEFYFPFMIPAIALAPTYWIGIAWLTNKNTAL